VDTSSGLVTLGVGSALDGKLVFSNVSNGNTVTILPGTPLANRILTLPDASGIICTDSGNCAGAGATLQTSYNFSVGGTTPKIKVNSTLLGVDIQDADTTIAANLFNVRASNALGLGSVMFGVGSTGAVTLQNSANSTTAFNVLTQGGTRVVTIDTTNGQTIFGQSTTLGGAIVLNNATNSNQITLSAPTATGARALSLPDESGTLCVQGSANCGFSLSSGSNSYIQNQSASNQAADFRISGTGRANVELQSPSIDTPTAAILAIGTTNATAIDLNQNTTVAATKTLTVTSGLTSLTGNTTGDALNVSNSTSTGNIAVFKDNTVAALTIANGGSTSIVTNLDSTTAFSVQGTDSSIVMSADTINNTVKLRTVYADSTSTFDAIWLQGNKNGGTAFLGGNDNVDAYLANDFSGSLRFNGSNYAWGDFGYYPLGSGSGNNGVFRFSTTGSTVNTTPNAKVGMGDLYVNGKIGVGTNSPVYTVDVVGDVNVSAGSSYRINGAAICTASGCTPAAGSANYIQNQSASQQATSSYWISGTGRADASIQAPLFDTATGAALAIGTTNATTINLNQNTTVAATKTLTVTSALTSLTGATTGDALSVSNSTSTGNIVVFKDNTTAVATVANGGATTFQNVSNSTSALRVLDSAGTGTVLDVDTQNARVGINVAAPTAALDVLGTANFSVGSTANAFRIQSGSGDLVNVNSSTNQISIGSSSLVTQLNLSGDLVMGSVLDTAQSFEGVTFPPASPGVWTTGGDVNWSRTTSAASDGTASAASGTIADSQSSWLDLDYTFTQNGTLIFSWQADSEQGFDYLFVCVDNDSCTSSSGYTYRISGATGWAQASIPVTAGAHSFRWVYSKDTSDLSGLDKGWVDNVRFVSGAGIIQGTNLQLAASSEVNITAGTGNVVLGTADSIGTLLVLDSKTTSGDPAGTNGGMYYSSYTGKFRCYESGAWTDCVTDVPHISRYYATAVQSLANASDSQLSFPFTDQSDGLVTVTGDNSFNLDRAGIWQIETSVRFSTATGGTGERYLTIAGAVVLPAQPLNRYGNATTYAGNFPVSLSTSATERFNAGDDVAIYVYQNSGAAMNTDTSWNAIHVTFTWLGY
ncbi:MAG TPA: hypothetical protein VF809_02650, partial [Candidatus Saccharimonadales bacterium]